MEVQLLTEMVGDRDRRIASLKRRMEDQSNKYSKILVEIKTVRNERLSRSESNRTEWEKLQIEKNQIETRLVRMLNDLRKQQGGNTSSSLNHYASIINDNAQQDNNQNSGLRSTLASLGKGGTDTATVMRLQAQLCKVMHSMGIVDHQMQLVQQTCDSLIKSLKDVINTQTEEKSLLELKLMNELMVEDDQRRHNEEKFKEKQAQYRKEIRKLEDITGEDLDDDDEDDEDEDSEDEEEDDEDEEDEERVEIRRAMREVQEQIAEQEQENEEQNDMIRALKVRISLLDMNIGNGGDHSQGGDEDSEGTTASEDSEDEDDEDQNHRPFGLSMVMEADETRLSERNLKQEVE